MDNFSKEDLLRLLEPSKMQYIKITTKRIEEKFGRFTYSTPQPSLSVTSSKFLGKPYFPKYKEYPLDKNSKPMIMLAQLNFAEIPPLENYPTEGILQFYITAYDELMGWNFDDLTDQSSFRVIYHPVIDEKNIKEDLPDFDLKDVIIPIDAEHDLSFSVEEEFVTYSDYQFKKYFGEDEFDFRQKHPNNELWENYWGIAGGHKIGGYAYFTQYDPRNQEKYSDYILLLQIDSEEAICWGDMGVGNWFIKEKDLKNKDFSKVLYNWDCS